jgi:hypothetical protein
MPQDSVSAFAYPLVYQANHMFVELPEGKFLVDTGAPHTFGRTGSVTYGARRVTIPSSTLGANVDSLEKLPGVRCDGLLGMDLMSTAQVLWDGPAGKAIVGETVIATAARRVPYRSLMGVPVVDFYALLIDKRELARGDMFHWTGPAYALIAQAAVDAIHRELSSK